MKEGQHFQLISNQDDTTISRDSSYTVRFRVVGDQPTLKFTNGSGVAQFLPAGTTIIMRVNTVENENSFDYYYYKLDNLTNTIELTSFSLMGGSGTWSPATNVKYDAQFVIDFSQATGTLIPVGTLNAAIVYGSGSFDETNVGSVTLVNEAAFGLTENTDNDNLTETLNLTTTADTRVNGGRATKWDNREMALVIEPNGVLPLDAKLQVIIKNSDLGEFTRNAAGNFIIPLGILSDVSDIHITLVSDWFPRTATYYDMTPILMVANSKADKSPLNGYAPTSDKLTFKSAAQSQPSVKIETDKRAYNPGMKVRATITMQNTEPYGVYMTHYVKVEANSWNIVAEGYIKKPEEPDYTFDNYIFTIPSDLPADTTYKLIVEVRDRDENLIMEVPYYFLGVKGN